jgi:hypothetical protein
LRATFDDMTLFSGPAIGLPATVLPNPPVTALNPTPPAATHSGGDSAPATNDMPAAERTVVLHYHLFKNAGTSVDAMLKHNFGARWGMQEFQTPAGRSNTAELAAYLREHPHLCALSSHTALLPVPDIDGLRIFPIIFLRHPIDRIRSAYEFERKQAAETFGAELAKRTDFAGYVQELMDHPTHRAARDFQTYRLAFNEPPGTSTEYERALRALAALPFVGLVEAYDSSIERLRTALLPYYPGFSPILVRKNATRSPAERLETRLAEITKDLRRDLYERLCAANSNDIRLFEKVRAEHVETQCTG